MPCNDALALETEEAIKVGKYENKETGKHTISKLLGKVQIASKFDGASGDPQVIDSDLLSVHGNVDLKNLKIAEKLTAKDLVVTDSISLPKTGIRKIDNPVGIQMEADTSDPTKYSLSVKNGLLADTYNNPVDDDETHATTTTLKGVVEIASQFNRTQPATTNRTLLNV